MWSPFVQVWFHMCTLLGCLLTWSEKIEKLSLALSDCIYCIYSNYIYIYIHDRVYCCPLTYYINLCQASDGIEYRIPKIRPQTNHRCCVPEPERSRILTSLARYEKCLEMSWGSGGAAHDSHAPKGTACIHPSDLFHHRNSMSLCWKTVFQFHTGLNWIFPSIWGRVFKLMFPDVQTCSSHGPVL